MDPEGGAALATSRAACILLTSTAQAPSQSEVAARQPARRIVRAPVGRTTPRPGDFVRTMRANRDAHQRIERANVRDRLSSRTMRPGSTNTAAFILDMAGSSRLALLGIVRSHDAGGLRWVKNHRAFPASVQRRLAFFELESPVAKRAHRVGLRDRPC
jgi:hypothetical protein